MKIQDKYQVRLKRFTEMMKADLRFLDQGISIANEIKSILIGYNELKELVIDDKLYLHMFFIKNYDNGVTYNYEVIECNEQLFNIISKKTKVKIKKIKTNAKLEDKVILKGMCKIRKDSPGENEFYLSHRKLLIKNDMNESIVIPLETISCIQKEGTTGMRFLYNNVLQELYYTNVDEVIKGIIDNKFEALKYTDNVDVNNIVAQPKQKNKISKIELFILVCSIILLVGGIVMIIKSLI